MRPARRRNTPLVCSPRTARGDTCIMPRPAFSHGHDGYSKPPRPATAGDQRRTEQTRKSRNAAHLSRGLKSSRSGSMKGMEGRRQNTGARTPVWSTLSLIPESFTATGMRLAPSVLPLGWESLQRLVRTTVLSPERVTSSAPSAPLCGRRSLLLPSFEIHMLRQDPSTFPSRKWQQKSSHSKRWRGISDASAGQEPVHR